MLSQAEADLAQLDKEIDTIVLARLVQPQGGDAAPARAPVRSRRRRLDGPADER
jgi:hypothetical protein